jgi:hypothetical protein
MPLLPEVNGTQRHGAIVGLLWRNLHGNLFDRGLRGLRNS